MGDISANFSRREFACDCINQGKKREDGYCGGEFKAVDIELVKCLEEFRIGVALNIGNNVYIKITGGNRCVKHNKDIGGAEHSYHPYAMGDDFKVFESDTGRMVPPSVVYQVIDRLYPDKYGLKQYHNRVHFDIRAVKWRSTIL